MTDFSHLIREANLIDGQWVAADDGGTIDVTNPADGTVIARVPNSGATETQRAINSAHTAFPEYAAMPLGERVALMRRLHDAILARSHPPRPMSCGSRKRPAARTARSSRHPYRAESF